MGWGLKPYVNTGEGWWDCNASTGAAAKHSRMMKEPTLRCGKEPGDESERSLAQQKGIPSVAVADGYVHHCCALLVCNYQSKCFFFNRKAHPVKNQNFPWKMTFMYLSVSLQLKEVLQFLKSFLFVFQFKKTGHFRK